MAHPASLLALAAYKLDPNDTRHHGYPNLNHTEMRMMPVRDNSQLERVLKINERTSDFWYQQNKRIFSLTGGVGRCVDTIRFEQDYYYNDEPLFGGRRSNSERTNIRIKIHLWLSDKTAVCEKYGPEYRFCNRSSRYTFSSVGHIIPSFCSTCSGIFTWYSYF